MIIFANNMQQEFIKYKDNKVLIATSAGSGKSYALYLKALTLLEQKDNFVGFCRRTFPQVNGSYNEFKDKFKNYKHLRFSDSSRIVEHKKTGSKVKFVTQEYCFGFNTVIVDTFNHFENLEYFKQVDKLYACINACDFDYSKHLNIFDRWVIGYGVCKELTDTVPNYLDYIYKLSKQESEKLLMESPKPIEICIPDSIINIAIADKNSREYKLCIDLLQSEENILKYLKFKHSFIISR